MRIKSGWIRISWILLTHILPAFHESHAFISSIYHLELRTIIDPNSNHDINLIQLHSIKMKPSTIITTVIKPIVKTGAIANPEEEEMYDMDRGQTCKLSSTVNNMV